MKIQEKSLQPIMMSWGWLQSALLTSCVLLLVLRVSDATPPGYLTSSSSRSSFGFTHTTPSTYMAWTDLPPIQVNIITEVNADDYDDADETIEIIVVGYCNKTLPSSPLSPSSLSTSSASVVLPGNTISVPSWLQDEISSASASAVGEMTTPLMLKENGKKRLLFVNFGKGSSKTTEESARKVGTALATLLQQKRNKDVTSCVLVLPPSSSSGEDDGTTLTETTITELLTSFYVGLYKDKRYKGNTSTKKNNKKKQNNEEDDESNTDMNLVKLDILVQQEDLSSSSSVNNQALHHRAKCLASAIYLARDIVNSPHNVLNSLSLAETAQRLARQHRRCLTCTILDTEQCQAKGMGAFLGVARGSETPARFIHLVYKSPNRSSSSKTRKLALIGKGLLMDTGGYNIKTSTMEKMKFDCGGAAAVLGAAKALALLEPPNVEVHILVAACENMINERAMVPGDILTAMNGKTIEVLNTDAEGRLTLADALTYADVELQCEELLEFSTLTGAVMVALGDAIAGMWTADDEMAKVLKEASDTTGEAIWQMPLNKAGYGEQIKSKLADLKNIGSGRFAGSITAALFLHEFVTKGKPFAHVDMAGTVWDWKASQASGWGVKIATEWILKRAASSSS